MVSLGFGPDFKHKDHNEKNYHLLFIIFDNWL